RIVRSVTPIISAASHHFNFPAIAFKITSCIFIIRSISAVGICPSVFSTPPSFPHPLLQADISLANSTGQLTCYRHPAAIKELCPGGVDVYFDNVGGPVTDAVLANLNVRARVAICGQISHANDTQPSTGPRMWRHILVARAKVQGFLVFDYAARYAS